MTRNVEEDLGRPEWDMILSSVNDSETNYANTEGAILYEGKDVRIGDSTGVVVHDEGEHYLRINPTLVGSLKAKLGFAEIKPYDAPIELEMWEEINDEELIVKEEYEQVLKEVKEYYKTSLSNSRDKSPSLDLRHFLRSREPEDDSFVFDESAQEIDAELGSYEDIQDAEEVEEKVKALEEEIFENE